MARLQRGPMLVVTVWPSVPSCANMVTLGKSLHHGTSVFEVVKDALGTIFLTL